MRRLVLAGALMGSLAACRGQISEEPPVHIFPDMDWQARYSAQGQSEFFADGRAMREPVEGTVARSALPLDDTALTEGKVGDAFVARVPFEVTEATLRRGQERYNIYCSACHDQTGSGQGMVYKRGYPVQPTNLSSERTRGLPDGELYDIIANGVRTMPAYGHQIGVHDRWAIVAWMRVLQRSQYATLDDVPPEFKNRIEQAEVGK